MACFVIYAKPHIMRGRAAYNAKPHIMQDRTQPQMPRSRSTQGMGIKQGSIREKMHQSTDT